MKEPILNDWIDQYLLGTIDPEHKYQLEQLMARDAAVAERVRDSQLAYEAIRLVRNKRLLEKMREWDKDPPRRQGFLSRRIGRISVFAAMVLISLYLAGQYFHPASMARRNFIDVRHMVTEGRPTTGMLPAWKEAEASFGHGDFEKAIQSYALLAELNSGEQHLTARWNLLMAQLALDGPTGGWVTGMDALVLHAPEPMASEGRRLNKLLGNTIYRWIYLHGPSSISQIKPRLI